MTDWAPPEEFDDYVIERALGQGAMGRVFLAHDAVLARPVAVKFIAALEPDAATRQRFLLEARATARLQHPNVVAIYRVGELDAKPYIVTEFVRGETLDKLALPVPGDRVLALGTELARGLAAAHRRGVIHGDIKPGNAIVGEDGVPKLLDFGLATLADTAPAGGKPRAIAGTPDYMAPEMWRGQPADRRTDVYALGAVLYHLLAGKPPFGDVPPRDLARTVQDKDPPRLATGSGDARLIAVIDRCLARDPAERWASGDELREALEQCRHHATQRIALPPGNPYRGLRPFEADHRQLFFGRTAELGVVLDRLRAEPFVLVAGDSGSGKSSLCRAAVVPAITDGALADGRVWSSVVLVPGRRPLRAIAAALATAFDTSEDDVTAALRGDGAAIRGFVRDKLGAGRGLVVFVDQLEELTTIAEADEAVAADRALARLAAGSPGLRLLATARADFLGRLAALPDLGEQLTRALLFLRPLGAHEIREVIVGPAAATGVKFETDAMVDELVAATAGADGGLPLLQFALAELWAARDESTGTITAAALASLGGVEGALSRHADQVIASLPPAQQTAARRVLTRLVTAEGTRARKTEAELAAGDAATRAALDALVRGRLLVAHEADDGSAYELSHEVLVRGWGTLRRWIVEDADQHMLADRVHAAAAEWERLDRGKDALWGGAQLADAARVVETELVPIDRAFLAASRRRQRVRWWARTVAIVAVPALVVAVYFGVQFANQRALRREVDKLASEAAVLLASGHSKVAIAEKRRSDAFAAFDALDDTADATWTQAEAATADAAHALQLASRSYELALSRDQTRDDVRSALGSVLLERAILDDRVGNNAERDEILDRISVYDRDGRMMARWRAPASLRLAVVPATARVTITRFDAHLNPILEDPRVVGPTDSVDLSPGSYVVVAAAAGHSEVRAPIVLERGTSRTLALDLPAAADVPPGMVPIPPGQFLFGTQQSREFFNTNPIHPRTTEGYLISAHEVTFADWIGFLDALPPAERAQHIPSSEGDIAAGGGGIRLAADGTSWRLELTLVGGTAGDKVTARVGEPVRYPGRDRRAVQDWSRFPVTGIDAAEAEAYVRWLAAKGTIPGARLCTEVEWERAARGADARVYPHGETLSPDDANYDATYGREMETRGLDEVGSHPTSTSPFGVSDMTGNAFEWTTSVLTKGYVLRGGSFFFDPKTCQIMNRGIVPPKTRSASLGFRICAPWPQRSR